MDHVIQARQLDTQTNPRFLKRFGRRDSIHDDLSVPHTNGIPSWKPGSIQFDHLAVPLFKVLIPVNYFPVPKNDLMDS